jgi:Big-like domain-containing protein
MTSISKQSRGFPSISSALLAALAAGSIVYGCGGDDLGKCDGPFCVSPGAPEATRIKAGPGDGQTGAPGRELPQSLVVVVTDDEDRPIADVEVAFTVDLGGGSVSESAVQSDIDGKAQVSWTLGTEPGPQTLKASASSTSDTPLQNSPLTLSAQAVRPPPFRVVLQTSPPEIAQNGVPFGQQPVVEVLDQDDLPIPQVQVIASIASGGGTLSGTATIASDGEGKAAYTDLAILGSKGPRTLKFSVADPALEVSSGTIQLDAGNASTLEGVQPLRYQGTVSSPVSPAPSVVAKDAAGNPVPGVAVTFTPNRDASVSPGTVVTDQNGVAQVTSWTLGAGADGEYALSAGVASTAIPPVVFSATAKAGTAGGLRITTQPPSAQSGTPLAPQPVIQIVDRNGNPAPQGGVRVTATVSAGSGTLDHATATTDGSGQARFSGLTLTGLVGSYTLSFSAPDLAGVASSAIALTAGPATKLSLAALPVARSRQLLSPQPSIQVQDASGNPVAQAGSSITATLTGPGTLGGTATVATDANGLATFTDLAISGAPGPQTLTFSSTGPALQSASVEVVLPGVAAIVVQPTPSSAVVGTTLTNVPSWVLKDASEAGQPVADVVVNLSASAGAMVPPSATSDANGVVQVQSWTLGQMAGDQFVVVAVTGTDLADTVHVQAVPGAATALLKVKGDSQTGSASSDPGHSLDSVLVVRAVDPFGNGVGGIGIQWRGCDGSGTYDDVTTDEGFSSATQPTGATPGTFCTRAISAGLGGSPVEFTYFVTAAAPSPSQSRINERSMRKPSGPAPVAPRRPSVVRP